MLTSTNFWFGVGAGLLGHYAYQKYAAKKGK